MQIKYIRIWSFIALGIGLILLTYLIMRIWPWQRFHNMFPVLNKEFLSWRQENMPKYVATSNAYALLQSWNYQEALAMISGEDATSYYNRGVIRTLTAYEQASGQDASWLQLANTLINEAADDFLLAQKLQINKRLDKQISTNLATATELAILINAKTCYVISTGIISSISGLQNNITTSQDILWQESQILQSRKALVPDDCFQRRSETIQQSIQNLWNLAQILTDQESIQQKIFLQKRQNPILCLQAQDTTVLTDFQKTKQKMEEFDNQHTQSTEIRNSWNPEAIQQLCQETANDAQINQGIQNTIQQLLSSLQQNVSGSQVPDFSNTPSSNQPNYIPLDADEQKLLESIDKKNKTRIRTLQRLKNDPEYSGMEYIQTLFQEFYGNTGDFISP